MAEEGEAREALQSKGLTVSKPESNYTVVFNVPSAILFCFVVV